jgi:hypothetical protein
MVLLTILLALLLVGAALFTAALNSRVERLKRKIDRLKDRIDRLKRRFDRDALPVLAWAEKEAP